MNSNRQDYLLTIYRLSAEDGYTSNKEISDYFEISKASVSEMIKKLVTDDLVITDKNRISLTEKGQAEAESLLSTHRIWEYFLTEILGMSKESVHEQADLLEHATSKELKEALNKYLNYPSKCPHGQEIFINADRQKP